jgi:hypothetical protein
MSDPTIPAARPASIWLRTRNLTEAVALGAAYGIFFRLFGSFNWPGGNGPVTFFAGEVMTLTFLLGGPIVIGFLTVNRAAASRPIGFWKSVVLPWLSVVFMLAVLWLFFIEGGICILMAAPIALFCSSVGGLVAALLARNLRLSGRTVTCIAILPLLLAPADAHLTPPLETRTVATEIRIHASPQTIWQNIERVPAISPAELQPNWTHRIGFPRPVEATLSYEGVGGVRHASFEHGLLFIETVTAWQPNQRLAFTIKADTAHIPPTTLDEHVTIGGRYFDVLDGEYALEPLPNGDVILHLTSRQRLSTDFNNYAGLWSDAVMQSLQTSILQVIQHRCEKPGPQLAFTPNRVKPPHPPPTL